MGPLIGIAGGIGSGKSTVTKLFAELGCAVIDADRIGHEVLRRPEIKAQLTEFWGPGILDEHGEIRRSAVAAIVFDPAGGRTQYDRLVAVTHPELLRVILRRIATLRNDPKAAAGIVLDAALLFEVGLDGICDAVVFVNCSRATREQRVRATRGWGPEEIARREAFQKSSGFKLEKAQHVVDNEATIERTSERVREIHQAIASTLPQRATPESST